MAVAEEHIAVASAQRQYQGIFKRFIQTMVTAHDYLLLILRHFGFGLRLYRLNLSIQRKANGR